MREALDRQYRLARQTLAIHHALKDGYLARSRLAELVLLVASVAFCATTFSADGVYEWIGFSARGSRMMLGVASVAAFAASLVLLVIDWKGRAARHGDAARRWSTVVARFQELRQEDGTWAADVEDELHHEYWSAAKDSVDIPDRRFNRLKARYLLKVELSKRIQATPGAPRLLLWLLVRVTGTSRAVRDEIRRKGEGGRDGVSGEASAD